MAKFSKQDYVSIARVIDDTWGRLLGEAYVPRFPGDDTRARIWGVKVDMEAVVTAFADMFEQDNDRFDRERFVMACEGESTDGTEIGQ